MHSPSFKSECFRVRGTLRYSDRTTSKVERVTPGLLENIREMFGRMRALIKLLSSSAGCRQGTKILGQFNNPQLKVATIIEVDITYVVKALGYSAKQQNRELQV